MKRILLVALALISSGCSEQIPVNQDDPNIEQIKGVFAAYNQDFIDNDFEGIASHFQTPVRIAQANALIAMTPDELMDIYRDIKTNIQEGYKYSIIDRLDVHRLASTVYYADADYTR